MNKYKKADATNIRLTYPVNYKSIANQRANSSNFKQNNIFSQCQKCGSDYLKYSIDGICQRCLQRVEFILREHPQVLAKLTKGVIGK